LLTKCPELLRSERLSRSCKSKCGLSEAAPAPPGSDDSRGTGCHEGDRHVLSQGVRTRQALPSMLPRVRPSPPYLSSRTGQEQRERVRVVTRSPRKLPPCVGEGGPSADEGLFHDPHDWLVERFSLAGGVDPVQPIGSL